MLTSRGWECGQSGWDPTTVLGVRQLKMRLKHSSQRAEKCLNRPSRDTPSFNNRKTLSYFFLFTTNLQQIFQISKIFKISKIWNVENLSKKKEKFWEHYHTYITNIPHFYSLVLEFRFFILGRSSRTSNKHHKRIARINITPCERNGRKKEKKKKQKRLENDYRHFFSAVSSGMSRILIPKGEHTVKVALGTPLSDLIKYLESIRDFLLPRPPFNRARITFWLPCCGFRPRKNYGKEGETIALYKLIGGNTSSGDYYTHTHMARCLYIAWTIEATVS